MFHLDYPLEEGYLDKGELSCFSRSLGYDGALFVKAVSDEGLWTDDGMLIQDIEKSCDYKLLHEHLHHTYNIHSDEWNVSVIRKALAFVDQHITSFSELQRIRVAYETYEDSDRKGLSASPRTLMRVLKMCGRAVSPNKLIHRLKHCADFEERGRLQLYEFLDILKWCVPYDNYDINKAPSIEGREDNLFLLLDFKSLLCSHNERIADRLDRQFWRDECDFGERAPTNDEKHNTDNLIDLCDIPVLRSKYDEQVDSYMTECKELKNTVSRSELKVKRARNGFTRPRPLSVTDISHLLHEPETVRGGKSRKEDARQKLQGYLDGTVRRSKATRSKTARVKNHHQPRTTTPCCVTPIDLHDTTVKMADLQFDMATMDSRYGMKKEAEMNCMLPDYRERQTASDMLEKKSMKEVIVDNLLLMCRRPPVKTKSAGVSCHHNNHTHKTRPKTTGHRSAKTEPVEATYQTETARNQRRKPMSVKLWVDGELET